MGKQAKAKSAKGVRNDSRKNGKANKQHEGSRGSAGVKLTEGQKILMGKGLYSKWERVLSGKSKGIPMN